MNIKQPSNIAEIINNMLIIIGEQISTHSAVIPHTIDKLLFIGIYLPNF